MKFQGLVPNPVHIEETGAAFAVPQGFAIMNDEGFGKELALFGEQIPFAFTAAAHDGTARDGRSAPALPLRCLRGKAENPAGTPASAANNAEGRATNDHSKPSADESYSLAIAQSGITCTASANRGMYHCLQTLRQIVLSGRGENGIIELPIIEITDAPRFGWRGFMLDCSRHFYSVAFIKKMIDAAAMHHLNVFHWHLTDDQGWRLPVEGYPKLTEIGAWRKDSKTTWQEVTLGGFYSEADIKDVIAYAAERHVEVVPEVDLPGHASAILAAYPELGCTGGPYKVEERYGIFKDVLCAGSDGIFPLFEKIFDTVVRLFPSKYVHIGGDEVKFDRWETCPKCQARLTALGLEKTSQLQSWITVRLATMLEERGKTPIGWDEVLEGTERLGLPQDMIVMSWRGQEGGLEASGKGHPVIMTPLTDGCYLNFKHLDNPEEPGHLEVTTIEKSYAMDPVVAGMSAEQERLVLGGQCNLWSEVIYASRIAEYMFFPRMGAIAEALWTPKAARSIESFEKRLPSYGKALDALDLLHYKGSVR